MHHFAARAFSRRQLTPIVAGSFCLTGRETVRGSFEEYGAVAGHSLQKIHSFGLGEFALATLAVALCIIAFGTGHRRRER